MAETIITVHGEFQIHHPAQRGVVRLIVGFEGARREDVLESTTRLHRELSEEISEMTDPSAGPVTRWSSDQVRVWGARPWSQDGSQLPIVYHGAADVDVTFSDLARLGHWLAGTERRRDRAGRRVGVDRRDAGDAHEGSTMARR
jgi:uncharacterized protein